MLASRMPESNFSNYSIHDLVGMLQSCGKNRDRSLALQLHSCLRSNGLETHRSIGNFLVPMLVDIGNIRDAQEVFEKLEYENEFSWNSLITGYTRSGNPRYALRLYQEMQKDNSVQPNGHTFVAVLKACTKAKDLERGGHIHLDIVQSGLLRRNSFVANSLIDMYAKCGSLTKAQSVFDSLPVRGVVSYNALITGYAEHGQGESSLSCFERMKQERVLPNAVTFICVLKACTLLKAIEKGLEIHAEIERHGLLAREFNVGTALVDMYAKCGLLDTSQEVFDKLQAQDVVSWTSLITGYVEHGHGLQAIKRLEQMQIEGVSPNSVTFVSCLKACASIRYLEKAMEIHVEIERRQLTQRDRLLGTSLVDMYCKCGMVTTARHVFNRLSSRDIISWNALISGYAGHGNNDEVVECFEQIQAEGVSPDDATFVSALKACSAIGDNEKGQEIHAEIERHGSLNKNILVGNSLVDMYAKCGNLDKAQDVFDKLPMQDVVSWTTLIAGYVEYNLSESAMHCFEKMSSSGVSPNLVTFVCSLKACANICSVEKGYEIHAEIERHRLVESDPVVGTSLVDMYAKCGSVVKAEEVFQRLPARDGVSWTALMTGYAQSDNSAHVFQAFQKMIEEGMKPNVVTFVVVLNTCSRLCLGRQSQTYFEAMKNDHGIVPCLQHHTCMVNLLARAGQLDEAVALINKMPISPDNIVWHVVLDACKQLGNVEYGNMAFKHALYSL